MRMKIHEVCDLIDELDKTISIQQEIVRRISNGEVLLDKSYAPHICNAIRHLDAYRENILYTEVDI